MYVVLNNGQVIAAATRYTVAGWVTVNRLPDGCLIWDLVREYILAKKDKDNVPRLRKINHPELVNVLDNPGVADFPGKASQVACMAVGFALRVPPTVRRVNSHGCAGGGWAARSDNRLVRHGSASEQRIYERAKRRTRHGHDQRAHQDQDHQQGEKPVVFAMADKCSEIQQQVPHVHSPLRPNSPGYCRVSVSMFFRMSRRCGALATACRKCSMAAKASPRRASRPPRLLCALA